MTRQAVLIFTKNAEAGKVKTRLAATIGNEAAFAVFHQLQAYTVSITASLPMDKFVFYADYIGSSDIWDNNVYHKAVQQGEDLGERMINAFDLLFEKGFEEVVIIGTDCPGIQTSIIEDAFAHLQACDVVVGPAEDGGYYLLGMKQLHAALFSDIHWSTATVLKSTLNGIIASGLRYHLLPMLKDVDEEKDLIALETWKK